MRPFRTPGSLLPILFGVTLVAVSALGFFGWKLLDQERAVEAQRAHERLEQTADAVAANAREAIAAAIDEAPPGSQPQEGLLLTIAGNAIEAAPPSRLLFRPATPSEPDSLTDPFADVEALEFQQPDPARALDAYRRLADSKTPVIRAGALLRLARVLRKRNQTEDAAQTYRQLARLGAIPVAGAPAELIARHALCELNARKDEALALKHDLAQSRWPLTRGQFEFYWAEASRLSGDPSPAPSEALAFSEAIARAWPDLQRDAAPRGQRTVWVDSRPVLLIWRTAPGVKSLLATRPEALLHRAFSGEDFSGAAVDAEGRLVAGHRGGASRAIVRTMAETQLPWTLYVTGAPGPTEAGMAARQRFLILTAAFMSLFLIGGAYFIARAIRRDLEVSRMKSDFISAVSHEFRTPLTSIRQLSEMLAADRVPTEGRRHVYYETLVREAGRLERLVEGLLNFGRMEAGAGPFRFDEVEVSALAARVAGEFESQTAGQGRRIEFAGAQQGCRIHADPEALSVALRNLVDNALKYSPGRPAVWVGWTLERNRVAIQVKDEGLGIPAAEQKTIFGKFIRGTAAARANVKGSGVGLAMVRHIVEAHGGDILLQSEPGRGSTFTMLLPAAHT
jgi:signal transduction histidine kinase